VNWLRRRSIHGRLTACRVGELLGGVAGLGWPAEAVQEVAELHAQRVEVAERRGKTNPQRLSSSEFKQGGEIDGAVWHACAGPAEGRSGSRRSRGRASGSPEAAREAGGREPAAEETDSGGADLRWSWR
jgi:hypothetical protein